MKTMIVMSGPEKAGKTTLAHLIEKKAGELGLTTAYTHFTGKEPVTAQDITKAKESLQEVVIWDRSWACGQVYKTLGFNQLKEAILEEGEEFGAVVRDIGITAIIYAMPPTLRARRTPDDLKIPPQLELQAFLEYGSKYEWEAYQTGNSMQGAHRVAELLLLKAMAKSLRSYPSQEFPYQ